MQAVGGDAMKALLMSAAVVGYLRGGSAWEAEQILNSTHSSSTTATGTGISSSNNGSNTGSGASSNGSSNGSGSLSPGGKAAGGAVVVRGVDEGPVGLRLSSSAALLAEHSAAAAVRGDASQAGSIRQRQVRAGVKSEPIP